MSDVQDLYSFIESNGIDEMGIIIEANTEPVYVNFEIEALDQNMRKQLFQQLCSLVYTYKTIGQIWSDEVMDKS